MSMLVCPDSFHRENFIFEQWAVFNRQWRCALLEIQQFTCGAVQPTWIIVISVFQHIFSKEYEVDTICREYDAIVRRCSNRLARHCRAMRSQIGKSPISPSNGSYNHSHGLISLRHRNQSYYNSKITNFVYLCDQMIDYASCRSSFKLTIR